MSILKNSGFMTPTLLLDRERVEKNIKKMATKAENSGVHLRPHIKTHKCIEIGKLQLKQGACGITVSTLDEAKIFAEAGFNDITYAVPMSTNKIKNAIDIASNNTLKLLVDNYTIVSSLNQEAKKRELQIEVLLKVHCGYQRTGVNPRDPASIKLVKEISKAKNLAFKGILTHAGHSYDASSIQEIKEIAIHEQEEMIAFADRLKVESSQLKPEIVSVGSTPTMTLADHFVEGITEIRPGNYVFFDYTQVALKTCRMDDCALTVLATIIGKYDDYFVIDSGATALSKDRGPTHIESGNSFGKILNDYKRNEINENLKIYSLSQEHGKVRILKQQEDSSYDIDNVVRILPNHSCLTANLHDCYFVIQNNRLVDKWRIRRERLVTTPC